MIVAPSGKLRWPDRSTTGNVQEGIGRPVAGLDEAESLGEVEPLHGGGDLALGNLGPVRAEGAVMRAVARGGSIPDPADSPQAAAKPMMISTRPLVPSGIGGRQMGEVSILAVTSRDLA